MASLLKFDFVILKILVLVYLGKHGQGELRVKRQFPVMYETFGDSRKEALNQLTDNHNVAMLSARSAVTSSMGQVYGNGMEEFASTVDKFLIPMKQAQEREKLLALSSQFVPDAKLDSSSSLPSLSKLDGETHSSQESQSSRVPTQEAITTRGRNEKHKRRDTVTSKNSKSSRRSATVKSLKPKSKRANKNKEKKPSQNKTKRANQNKSKSQNN